MPFPNAPWGFPQYLPVTYPIGWVPLPGQLPSDDGDGTGQTGGGNTQSIVPGTVGTATPATPTFASGSPLVVRYTESGGTPTSAIEAHPSPPMRIYLGVGAAGPTIPGSLRFIFRGRTYVDRAGALYYDIDPLTNAGSLGGSYDYANNVATLTDYGATGSTVTITSMATRYTSLGTAGVMFHTPARPLNIGAFTIRATTMAGVELIGSVDINGDITGTGIKGHVDWETGLVRLVFGALVTAAGNEAQPWYSASMIDGSGNIWRPTMVDPDTIIFGTVAYHTIPVDPTIIHVDPVRLPSDGRVLGFNPGTPLVVSHTQTTTLTPTAGATTDLGREDIAFIEIVDAAGTPVDSVWYTVDLDAGHVVWSDPLNLSGYTMPVRIRDRIQNVRLIADVQITGEITLTGQITHNFPAGTIASNAVPFDNTQARYTNLFDQQTYMAGQWSDTLSGSPAAGTYNDVTYPIEVSNDAAIDERWAFVFESPTTINVIGETVGQVLTGVSITADIAPINPVTITLAEPAGKPYFTLRKEGWGGGWAAANMVRVNTISATRPMWLARCVTPGDITSANDSVRAQVYGNAH